MSTDDFAFLWNWSLEYDAYIPWVFWAYMGTTVPGCAVVTVFPRASYWTPCPWEYCCCGCMMEYEEVSSVYDSTFISTPSYCSSTPKEYFGINTQQHLTLGWRIICNSGCSIQGCSIKNLVVVFCIRRHGMKAVNWNSLDLDVPSIRGKRIHSPFVTVWSGHICYHRICIQRAEVVHLEFSELYYLPFTCG